MDSNMKLKFGHPCNNCYDMEKPIYKVRTIPLKSKSRTNLGGNHFSWKFTQWGPYTAPGSRHGRPGQRRRRR